MIGLEEYRSTSVLGSGRMTTGLPRTAGLVFASLVQEGFVNDTEITRGNVGVFFCVSPDTKDCNIFGFIRATLAT